MACDDYYCRENITIETLIIMMSDITIIQHIDDGSMRAGAALRDMLRAEARHDYRVR